ncbi:MAG: hypothetical protein B6U68_02880 [Candidatus Aenigmarchaeota archaeon ex4484_14]|nr:MAG: hypothetical protein B6U68_02880 [Candidatus Aenigmarchaeota archaeon ex4484_14]
MQLLFIHASWISYEVREKTKIAENLSDNEKARQINNCLVVKTCVEKKDKEDVLKTAKKEIITIAEKVGAKHIVLFPFAHLSPELSSPKFAIKFLKDLKKALKTDGYEVDSIPFGWIKKWALETKGHALAVLSRRF